MYCMNKNICLLALLLISSGAGCACGPCGPMMSGGCADGGCGGDPMVGPRLLNPGLLAGASCRAGCGEVYVDEWLNEPPVVDNCGGCGGCNSCGQRQPIRTALRLLWGTPYQGSCEGACDGMGHGSFHTSGSDCGCGASHSSHAHSSHATTMGPSSMMAPSAPVPVPSSPMEFYERVPSPTPAPSVAPPAATPLNAEPAEAPATSTTKRLNPARNKSSVRAASGSRN